MRSATSHRFALMLITPLALLPGPARACTAFLLEQDGEVVVGKSYDWDHGQALVLHNQAGVAKSALPFFPGSKPHRWVSRYASLTFNQYGREFPVGGMNAAGLVVETLWLGSARAEPPDERPALNELQWVQWALDSFATVEELLRAHPGVRVERIHGKVHYLVCDRQARCAACEPLADRFACQAGEALPARVLTNDTYEASRAFLRTHRGFGGERPIPKGNGSLERFARTAAALALPPLPRVPAEARAFALLDSVRLGDYSKWNLVYLLRAGRVLWRTSARRDIRHADLARFEPGCDKPVSMLDIQAAVEGDAAGRFAPYTDEANLKLLGATLGDLPLPPGTAALMTAFAGRFACAPALPAARPPGWQADPTSEARLRAESLVREGYATREEIVESVSDMLDGMPVTEAARLAARLADETLADQRERERAWTEPTDPDRLSAAFAALERRGILAREKFTCCQRCGHGELLEELLEAKKHKRPIRGYVFFHDQDVEGVLESGSLLLAYGSADPAPAGVQAIAQEIVDELTRQGLEVEWDGSLRHRIAVVDLDWRRRRFTRPPGAGP